MHRVDADGQDSTDAVAAAGVDTRRCRDEVGTRQMAQRVVVDELAGAVHDAPPPALPPLPPGPADPEIVRLVERRVDVSRRSRRAQIVANLPNPERRRHLGRLLDALLKPRAEKRRIAIPM